MSVYDLHYNNLLVPPEGFRDASGVWVFELPVLNTTLGIDIIDVPVRDTLERPGDTEPLMRIQRCITSVGYEEWKRAYMMSGSPEAETQMELWFNTRSKYGGAV